MAWIVPLLLILGAAVTTTASTDALKPGALLAPVGRVLMVEDVVTVTYNLNGLLDIPKQMQSIINHLDTAMNIFHDLRQRPNMSAMVHDIINLQTLRIKNLYKSVINSGRSLPPTHEDIGKRVQAQIREKRGLFNFVGMVSSALFGTATAEDVAKLGRRMNVVTQAVIKQNRAITQTYQAIHALESKVNEVIAESNQLTSVVRELSLAIPTFEGLLLFSEYLHAAEVSAQTLTATNNRLIDDLVNAGLGRVDAQLLPIHKLLDALHIATGTYHLTPIFQDNEVEYYYPLLEATLTHDTILIHIPMLSDVKYNAWHLEPFPMEVNNTLLTLDKQSELILLAEDFSLLAVEDPTVLL